jgi:hypothetical protein
MLSIVYDFGAASNAYFNLFAGSASSANTPAFFNATNIAVSPAPVPGVSGPLTLGAASDNPGGTNRYDGHLKFLGVYSKKLTIEELTAIYAYIQTIPVS